MGHVTNWPEAFMYVGMIWGVAFIIWIIRKRK